MADFIIRLTHAEVQTILIRAMGNHYQLEYNDEDADCVLEVDAHGIQQAKVIYSDLDDFECGNFDVDLPRGIDTFGKTF